MLTRIYRKWIVLLTVVLVSLAFQNCSLSDRQFKSVTAPWESASGNGTPYEGKIFASATTCLTGGSSLRISYSNATSEAFLIRRDCIDQTPLLLSAASYQYINSSQPTLIFENTTLAQDVNQTAFVKIALANNYDPARFTAWSFQPFATPVYKGSTVVCSILYADNSRAVTIAGVHDNAQNVFKPALATRAQTPVTAVPGSPVTSQTLEVWYLESITATANPVLTIDFTVAGQQNPDGAAALCSEYAGVTSLLSSTWSTGVGSGGPVDLGTQTASPGDLVYASAWGDLNGLPIGSPFHGRYLSGPHYSLDFLSLSVGTFTPSVVVLSLDWLGAVLTFQGR